LSKAAVVAVPFAREDATTPTNGRPLNVMACEPMLIQVEPLADV
jgi:hypothetical protein